MNVTTVIFDLGRVLVNISTSGEKFSAVMAAMGIDPSRAFEQYWHKSEVLGHMTGSMTSADFYQAARDHFGFDLSFDEFAEGWCDLFQPVAGMEELFNKVAAKYRIGILSDTDPLHWDRIRSVLPWLTAVEHPTLSYNVGWLKPHPAMYETAARDCGSRKEDCLFIDDVAANVDGARMSGMPALRFRDPDKLLHDLTGLGVL